MKIKILSLLFLMCCINFNLTAEIYTSKQRQPIHKEMCLNLIKTYFSKLYGPEAIRYVYDYNNDKDESKMIQRYFDSLSIHLDKLLHKVYSLKFRLTDGRSKPINNMDELIELSKKELNGVEVYFIIHGKKWEVPQVVLPGFNPDDPDQNMHKFANCPSRKKLSIVEKALQEISDSLVAGNQHHFLVPQK